MDREARIRARAYDIWEAEGAPSGRHEEHWTRAASEIDGAEADVTDTASDAGAGTSAIEGDQAGGKDVAETPAASDATKPKRAPRAKTGEAAPAAKAPVKKAATSRAPRSKGKTSA